MRRSITLSLLCLCFYFVKAQVSVSGIINIYTHVDSIGLCDNSIYVQSAAGFSIGDRVLLIQMKGADINLTNTASFGNISSYNNAGNYEFGTIAAITGSAIQLQNMISRIYTISGIVQLIRVPVYSTVNIDDTLRAQDWNGITGGILAFEADTVNFNSAIDVSGKGFRGGSYINYPTSCPFGLGSSAYYADTISGNGDKKGEGIAILAANYLCGRGKSADGAGGGDDHNSGGGGGGNGADGGIGGRNIDLPLSCPGNSPGTGGLGLDHTDAQNRIYPGGGGGAGHGNNNHGTSGTDGGGVVIINAGTIIGNDHVIRSNGLDQTLNSYGDGSGGGGAGGTILINAQYVEHLSLEAKGGKGGNETSPQCTGPGGGGAGGAIRFNTPAIWPTVTTTVSGGAYGTLTNATSDCFGSNNDAAYGTDGQLVPGLIVAEGTTPFILHFADAGDDTSLCAGGSFHLNASGGISYSWSPSTYLDDPFILNPLCSPATSISYLLTETNASGYADHDTLNINVFPSVTADAGTDAAICTGGSVELSASGGTFYSWSPSTYLDDASISNPTCTPLSDINYQVTVSNIYGCSDIDSVSVHLFTAAIADAGADISVCSGTSVAMNASGGTNYSWSPSTYLDDASVSNPTCTPFSDISYIVTVTNGSGCTDANTVNVHVYAPVDAVVFPHDTTICSGQSIKLIASGGISYAWSPPDFLNFTDIFNPASTPPSNITYVVAVTDADGCVGTDTVNITVLESPVITTSDDTTICKGDAITLSVSGALSYLWSPAAAVPCDDCAVISVSPGTTTTYYVTGTNDLGCTDEDTVTVFVQQCNAVKNISPNEINIYPNPAGKIIYADINTGIHDVAIDVFDMQGEKISATILHNGTHYEIHLPEIAAGEIIIRVSSEEGIYNKMIFIER